MYFNVVYASLSIHNTLTRPYHNRQYSITCEVDTRGDGLDGRGCVRYRERVHGRGGRGRHVQRRVHAENMNPTT